MSDAYQVTSEIAYDLMQDHLDTILALLDKPLREDEVLERLGSPVALKRLLRHGLVAREGDELRAVSGVYDQVRQEGMMSFLERYLLPALTDGLSGQGEATLENRVLSLDESQMRGFYDERVLPMFHELAEISDRPAAGLTTRLTVLVIGTSRVLPNLNELAPEDAALMHLKQASLQRADGAERDLARLSQLDMLADAGRYAASVDILDRFAQKLQEQRASSLNEATYHVTVASFWRSASAEVTPSEMNPC